MAKKQKKRLRNLMDGSDYGSFEWLYDDRERAIQGLMELADSETAQEITFRIPADWAQHIGNICKKCNCQPDFIYRKAFQAFFGLGPAIFDDDGYLVQWREIYELDGEDALRQHIQAEDDTLTRRVIAHRNIEKRKKKNRKLP